MDEVFKKAKGTRRYMDDMIIFGKTAEEHDENLRNCLKIVEANRIPLTKKKCQLNQEEVLFLGFKVGKFGIRQSDERVDAILKLQTPSSRGELHSLLGKVRKK